METDVSKESPEKISANDKPMAKKGGKGKKNGKLLHPAQLNYAYTDLEWKKSLTNAFKNRNHVEKDGCVLHSEPFSVCEMPRVITDEAFLDGLKDELLDQIFHEKNNDLYKFQQSDDLKKITTPHMKAFKKFLHDEVLAWLKDVTGIPLNNKIDYFCARYDYTDTLLCHDDELEGRRIAYILYLVPPWKPQDGGQLDLFDMDAHGQPRNIVKSILPQCNTLAWFEVTPASFHQVGEVLTEDKTRLSVSGWFHGPPIVRPTPYVELPRPLQGYMEIDEEMVYDWLNPIYLDPSVLGQIQEKFESDSEIELHGFLKEEKYQAVMEAISSSDITWNQRGPANKRQYGSAEDSSLPEVLQQCLQLLRSEAMFLTLSNLTGLALHPLATSIESDHDSDAGSYTEMAPSGSKDGMSEVTSGSESENSSEKMKPHKKRRKLDSGSKKGSSGDDGASEKAEDLNGSEEQNPRCRGEVRRWQQGSYTLVHDTDAEGQEFALDAMFFCGCKGWQQDYGGFTSYIARGEDEELLTVNPAENSLALVYRDKDTLRFVKHVNARIKDMPESPEFYDISMTYFE